MDTPQEYQSIDEPAVGNFIGTAGGRNTGDPQASVGALFLLAVVEGHAHGPVHRLGGGTEEFAASAAETTCQFQAAASAFAGCGGVG